MTGMKDASTKHEEGIFSIEQTVKVIQKPLDCADSLTTIPN